MTANTSTIEFRRMLRGAWWQNKLETRQLRAWLVSTPADEVKRAAKHDRRLAVLIHIYKGENCGQAQIKNNNGVGNGQCRLPGSEG